MEGHQLPQYHRNNLSPAKIDKESLQTIFRELQAAIRHGVDLLQNNVSLPDDPKEYGSIYSGTAGVALAFMRLHYQAKSLVMDDSDPPMPDFRTLARERVLQKGPPIRLDDKRFSPLGTRKFSAIYVRCLEKCFFNRRGAGVHLRANDIGDIAAVDMHASHDAIRFPRKFRDPDEPEPPGEEVLYGRAGLLWGLENLQAHPFDDENQYSLRSVFSHTQSLVDVIIQNGKIGAEDVWVKKHGEKGPLPLTWTRDDGRCNLGAIHGVCGTLTILLQCKPWELEYDEEESHYPIIADTITELCKICISNNGHLPTSLPVRPSNRASPLVQICHGVPGLMLLLATAKQFISEYEKPEWDEALRLGTDRVWEEGLLSKGGGVCHGHAGNAWPLLLLHVVYEYSNKNAGQHSKSEAESSAERGGRVSRSASRKQNTTGDSYLAKALAMLLYARKTQPFSNSAEVRRNFRMPDRPYSLFEGLAGTVCAWADACAIIRMRLRKMELAEQLGRSLTPEDLKTDEAFREHSQCFLGMVGFGGLGLTGGL
ncbi:lanthionine synthetase C family protein [Paecilomyces variotii]|uniref:Lanthionine synthetase C family protein n=1 Tax=Byssochlamys spectabilis TaxID=264951 RepID=A0A443I0G1_BYSSP|nr:lanthionine synthetase C family protein [Paecilomyces variotii]KAJ9251853.1 hypothetical protein DTO207G8_5068 [Paecilomyces variotii]KAJ9355645.1 hypothetical protein DTO027B9_4100 [Paecilomyces variotii]KAJ9365063.1 hypothetical protein DTO280E4_718 [Paecilomyces variotii]KAJ9369026.1 hypothetical protein DTO282E5_6235 [Paecilomyces variotii]KAJ9386007.1 hypothetical protein DTO063F5_3971 [Paecilomyces variotii]